jgi:site-specific recombinase XerD
MMPVATRSLLDHWTEWLSHDAPRRLTPATIREYRRHVISFAEWLERSLGVPFQPEGITPARVEQYAALLTLQVQHNERKIATYNKQVVALSRLGTWLFDSGLCAENPARRLRTMTQPPGPPGVLTKDIIGKLLEAAQCTGDLRDALIVELLAHTGMRTSEVAAIQLEDREVGQRTTWIWVWRREQKQRRVPLPKHVGELLERYLAHRTANEGVEPTTGPLLVGKRGGITRATINRTVLEVVARAQLTPAERTLVTPRALRHSVAMVVVQKRDLVIAAELLGHRSLSTMRRYSKPSAQDLEAAVSDLYSDE